MHMGFTCLSTGLPQLGPHRLWMIAAAMAWTIFHLYRKSLAALGLRSLTHSLVRSTSTPGVDITAPARAILGQCLAT